MKHPSLVLFALLLALPPAGAQEPYRAPPDIVRRIMDAPPLPAVEESPTGTALLLVEREGLPALADLAQPMLRLAGLRINPQTNAAFRVRLAQGLTLYDVATGTRRPIPMPPGARLDDVSWAPDGARFAFTTTTDRGVELWVGETASGASRAVTGPELNGVLGAPCTWMPSATQLLCRLVPADRGPLPQAPFVPTGPIVQRNEGRAAPVRTYQDLLESPHDERLFDHYATSQLVLLDVTTGARTAVGSPGIFLQHDPAPGGRLLLVTRVVRPYSYLVPVWSFARELEVWTLRGERAVTLASLPPAEQVPVDGVPTGPRSAQWRPGEEATVVYVEALDGGDNRRRAEVRDRVVSIAAPFTVPVELGRLAYRYAGTRWGRDGLALVSEYDRPTRRMRVWKIDTHRPAAGWRILMDRSAEDRYGDPGTPVLTRDAAGETVLLQSRDGRWVYLRGAGASPEGDRPFLDRMNLENRKTERLWQSEGDVYESVAALLDAQGRRVVTRQESRTAPPNYLLRDVRSRAAPVALTELENPAPELATVRRELLTYERADGVALSGTLYYPTGYQDGQRVPVVFWIYPREFASADAAGQVTGSPNRFVLPGGSSHLFLLTQGYAVLDNPTLPVVGGDSANDTYVEQTVAGAKAAIDHLMARGIADGNFGVGGHSYGAFATANLLAHSDLFKAGVARSGAYNRTLTPFGFQNERRTFWEARDVYLAMMPFTFADQINEPILLIHGMNDNNSGTFPIQSERMYHALKGHGATVEYVQLPFESHGYAARESVMDVVARMIEWFDRYVKDGKAAS
ncbi:MAG: prolyl oligopeptidase family serine peptidase [Gemmatimonadota bacterium]|nr:prolyl oligopeptidase family serine peptidase [Gemmatimonadota bacterium]